MYRNFIRKQTRRAFTDLSAGRVNQHIRRFHDGATLRIDRDGSVTVLEGRARIHSAMQSEFGEKGRHAFSLDDILVSGHPGNTRVAVLWHDTGTSGPRRGMNFIRLRWGRVVEEYLFAGSKETQRDEA